MICASTRRAGSGVRPPSGFGGSGGISGSKRDQRSSGTSQAGNLVGGMANMITADHVAQVLGSALKQRWSKESIIAALRESARRSGGHIDERLSWACIRHFGSVPRARQAAGVRILYRRWTKRTIIAELRAKWKDRRVMDAALGFACKRVFGGVPEARRAAGLPLLRRG